jgi:hypothetical protein
VSAKRQAGLIRIGRVTQGTHFYMPNRSYATAPSDICLLLRADAEQHWLHREVIPVLRDIETRERLPDDQVEAALAYLEATWSEAELRARATDAARGRLRAASERDDGALAGPAQRYHTAVRVLRGLVAERVTQFIEPPLEAISYASARGRPARL